MNIKTIFFLNRFRLISPRSKINGLQITKYRLYYVYHSGKFNLDLVGSSKHRISVFRFGVVNWKMQKFLYHLIVKNKLIICKKNTVIQTYMAFKKLNVVV